MGEDTGSYLEGEEKSFLRWERKYVRKKEKEKQGEDLLTNLSLGPAIY